MMISFFVDFSIDAPEGSNVPLSARPWEWWSP